MRGYPTLRGPLPPLHERGQGLVFGPGICLVKNVPQYAIISVFSCFVGANLVLAVVGNMMENGVFQDCLNRNGWPVRESEKWGLGVFKQQRKSRERVNEFRDYDVSWWVHPDRYFADVPANLIELLTREQHAERVAPLDTIGARLASALELGHAGERFQLLPSE